MPRQEFAWRILLASLLCCVFEGALRKWVLNGNESAVARVAYLSKYLVMAAFLGFNASGVSPVARIAQPYLKAGVVLILLGAVVSTLSGFNLVGAVLSVCNFILLPMAAWKAGLVLPRDALLRFSRTVAILALMMAPLGVAQFYSPASARINKYITEGESVATAAVSQRIRATGTFSYISGMSEFANIAVWAGVFLTAATRKRLPRLGYAAALAGLACTFVTVSRATAIISLGIIAAWALLGGGVGRKIQGVFAMLLVIGFAGISLGVLDSVREVSTTVYARHEIASDTLLGRLHYTFVGPFEAVILSPLGNGFGTEAGGNFKASSVGSDGKIFESAWGRTVNQLGVLGLIGLATTWGMAIAPGLHMYRCLPAGIGKSAFAATLAALAMRAVLGYQFNHVAAYLFWSMVACLLALGNNSNACVARESNRSTQ